MGCNEEQISFLFYRSNSFQLASKGSEADALPEVLQGKQITLLVPAGEESAAATLTVSLQEPCEQDSEGCVKFSGVVAKTTTASFNDRQHIDSLERFGCTVVVDLEPQQVNLPQLGSGQREQKESCHAM